MANSEPISVYLDQNILGHVQDGSIRLDRIEGVRWIYSNEHFEEIRRGSDRSFLDTLRLLRAQRMEVQLDAEGRILDQAITHPYACPIEMFDRHVEACSAFDVSAEPHMDFLARLHGADNMKAAQSVPDRVKEQIESLLTDDDLSSTLRDELGRVTDDLGDLINDELGHVGSLEEMRKLMGTSDGRAGSIECDSPIPRIWALISKHYSEIDIDEFFGFSPKHRGNYENWPRYLGIIGCHSVLNFVGYRTDKGMTNASSLPGILSDGIHMANAAFCQVVLSADRRFCDKAAAIYQFRNIGTQVLQLTQKEQAGPSAASA